LVGGNVGVKGKGRVRGGGSETGEQGKPERSYTVEGVKQWWRAVRGFGALRLATADQSLIRLRGKTCNISTWKMTYQRLANFNPP
jgi:hypothetical protein